VNDETPDEPGASSGDPQVDAALGRLSDLDETDLDQQAEVFDGVQRALSEALASPTNDTSGDLDDRSASDDGAGEA
jgi:hypothetical protein